MVRANWRFEPPVTGLIVIDPYRLTLKLADLKETVLGSYARIWALAHRPVVKRTPLPKGVYGRHLAPDPYSGLRLGLADKNSREEMRPISVRCARHRLLCHSVIYDVIFPPVSSAMTGLMTSLASKPSAIRYLYLTSDLCGSKEARDGSASR